MGTTEVQRTLVKSPPELWAELSDQDSLARHLSELGEIRIVSTVGESAVHWESDEASGRAVIQQAGWGTKVTLAVTVSEAPPAPQHPPTPVLAAAHAAPATPPAPLTAPAPLSGPIVRTGSAPLTAAALRAAAEPVQKPPHERDTPPSPVELASSEHDVEEREAPEPEAAEPEQTRRGFLSRLFGRRARRNEERDQQPAGRTESAAAQPPESQSPPAPEAQRSVEEPAAETHAETAESVKPVQPTALEALEARFARPHAPPEPPAPLAQPEPQMPPAPVAPPEPTAEVDLSSELRSAEEVPAGEVRATPTEDQLKEILTGVLDRLGAAHHRPFSRA